MAQPTSNIAAVPTRTAFFRPPEAGKFSAEGMQDWRLARTWILFFESLVQQPAARVTFNFLALSAALESSHVRIPQTATSYNPIALDINATGAPTGGDAIFDLQISKDDNAWTSILTAPAHLASGSKFAPTVGTFAAVGLPAQYWLRAIVAGGSTLTATNVNLELTVSRQPSSNLPTVTSNTPSTNYADAETPAGAINGSNVTFTLAHTPNPAASLILVLSGAVLIAGTDYTLTGNTITLTLTNSYKPTAGIDWLLAWYRW